MAKQAGKVGTLAVNVDLPLIPANGTATVGGGLAGALCIARGTISAPDSDLDGDPVVHLYNSTGTAPAPDNSTLLCYSVFGQHTSVFGQYSWEVKGFANGDAIATSDSNLTTANNTLHVLVQWRRNIGMGMSVDVWEPHGADEYTPGTPAAHPYHGIAGDCPLTLIPALAKSHASATTSATMALLSVTGYRPVREGDWLVYRDLSATTRLPGQRLLDEDGSPLTASQIAIYAFDVDWSYSYPPQPHHARVARNVRRPIGDILSPRDDTSIGSTFFTTLQNSLVLWQADTRTTPFQRTAIISQSEAQPDLIDLDSARDIYLHLNVPTLSLLGVGGSYSVAVRVLRR